MNLKNTTKEAKYMNSPEQTDTQTERLWLSTALREWEVNKMTANMYSISLYSDENVLNMIEVVATLNILKSLNCIL